MFDVTNVRNHFGNASMYCRREYRRLSMAVIIAAIMSGHGFSSVNAGPLRPADVIDETGAAAAEWLAKKAASAVTIHSSGVAVWQVYDTNAYLLYKSNIDSLIALFDRAVPVVLKNFGASVNLPVSVVIDRGECCGGWASTNAVGFRIENFNSNAVFPNCNGFTAVDWTRGVIIGEFANHAAANGSSGCQPLDWRVDHVWYFPDMVVVNVLAEVLDSAAARKWELNFGCSDLMNVPLYRAFKDLHTRYGWQAYQSAFKAIRDDSISFCGNFTNPSVLLTNYMLTYLSIGAGENISEAFRAAGASGADSATVNKILSARKSLRECPAAAGGNSAWQAYRNGNYQTVNVCSPYTSCRFGKSGIFPLNRTPSAGIICIADVSGRVIKKLSFDRDSRDQVDVAMKWGTKLPRLPGSPGVYIVSISVGEQNVVRRMLVAR